MRTNNLLRLRVRSTSARMASRSLQQQVHFNMSYQVQYQAFLDYGSGIRSFLGSSYNQSASADSSFFMDMDLCKNYQAMYDRLSSTFAGFRLCSPTSRCCRDMVRAIRHEVGRRIDKHIHLLKKHNNVLTININILKFQIHSFQEQEVVDIFMRRSMLEYEGNCGMVPTARKSRRLKCVKVGTDQSETEIAVDDTNADAAAAAASKDNIQRESKICTICLDELEDFAAQMPCGHIFHGTCIYKWLENSHYCPICRYQMPTET